MEMVTEISPSVCTIVDKLIPETSWQMGGNLERQIFNQVIAVWDLFPFLKGSFL